MATNESQFMVKLDASRNRKLREYVKLSRYTLRAFMEKVIDELPARKKGRSEQPKRNPSARRNPDATK
jgi:hypothetical protein